MQLWEQSVAIWAAIITHCWNVVSSGTRAFVSHDLRVFFLSFSKFQVGCHVPCAFFLTQEQPQSGFYHAGWLADYCGDGFPFGGFSCLQRGTLELWQWLLGSWCLPWWRSFSSDGSVEMADQLCEEFWWFFTFSTSTWWRRLFLMRLLVHWNIFCTLPQMWLHLKTLPSQRSTGNSLDFTLVSWTVNCGFLHRQVFAFLNHVSHFTEPTTSGLSLSYRSMWRMTSGLRVHLILSLNFSRCDFIVSSKKREKEFPQTFSSEALWILLGYTVLIALALTDMLMTCSYCVSTWLQAHCGAVFKEAFVVIPCYLKYNWN